MWRWTLLLGLLGQAGVPLDVQVRNSEVWLVRDGQPQQLTHDGKAKIQAALSLSQDRIAYYEECPVAEHCTPSVVILNLDGRRFARFQPKSRTDPQAACMSILSIAWVGDRAIAAECHINPSLREYIVTDLSTGRTTRDLLGYEFVPAPNGSVVAHVGWIPHFAPPPGQSNYLQIDRPIVYPLPAGMKPAELKDAEPPPSVVRQTDLTFSGIHEFGSGPLWAPDSEKVALVDCTYDWTANFLGSFSVGDGQESNRQCSVVAVCLSGRVTALEIPSEEIGQVHLRWLDSSHLSVVSEVFNAVIKVN